ncbi:integrator complex subunit 2-like [Tropilaelaps mercedesae]|uniref:Integrator complex subunit 2-like n=1 Tax=Tropilaelaps mercedesae TaxID=418985 RepID=A0A1V9X6S7_9ACAR|nr:integrator complex subunit 2-like [Tropilaelaps mercedesae]
MSTIRRTTRIAPQRAQVSARAFSTVQRVDVEALVTLPEWELRPLLPCLVRMALCAPLDTRVEWARKKEAILRVLSGIESVNSLVALLSIDFHLLEIDVRKDQILRSKAGPSAESLLVPTLTNAMSIEFERSDAAGRLRLVLSQLLTLMGGGGQAEKERGADLFTMDIYVDEVADVLSIAHTELPGLLSVADMAEALLLVKNGAAFIIRLVANSPESFLEVAYQLISNASERLEDSDRRADCLGQLCRMNPSEALQVRARAVEMCRMPELCVLLTLEQPEEQSDLVAFVSGLLLGSDEKVRNWFATYVRTYQKRPEQTALSLMRAKLLHKLRSSVSFNQDYHELAEGAIIVEMNGLIRLYSALKVAGMRFSDDENQILLQVVTCRCQPTPAGVRFVCLSVSMLLSCPTLIATQEFERQALEYLRYLVSQAQEGVAELLLLVAIHFHANQLGAIAELVCTTLAMRVAVRPNSLAKMRSLFIAELFTEQVVTAHAIRVPVTPRLNADVTGFLPVHCVYQLLKSRSFSKQRVSIKDWVYRQLLEATTPLHPILPSLIEVYVHSVLSPVGESTHQPLTDAEVISASKSSGSNTEILPCLLMLYYLLLYEDVRLANIRQLQGSSKGRKVKTYSADLITRLPIRYLVQQTQQEQRKYAGLFAPLLRLLAHQFPHLCMTEDWLLSETTGSTLTTSTARKPPTAVMKLTKFVTPESLDESLSRVETCPIGATSQLAHVLQLELSELWPFAAPLVSALPGLISPTMPRQVVEKARALWFRLNQVYPRRLWVLTVNAFRPTEKVTLDELIMDPLHVLRCDPAVLRCAVTLEIVLHMLRALLAASRTQLSLQLAENCAPDAASANDRDELRVALVAAQESAAVQILLEICLASGDEGLLSSTRECRTLVCSQLHQMFIADPQLVHLVHYQGYPSALLPMTVSLVPSMHICLDFIPELLAQPQLDKQVFAIELTSYLCLQHAIPRSLSIARLCITVANTLLGVLPSSRRPQLFLPALPALVRMCRAFPPLSEDVAILLLQLAKVCLSQESTKALPDIGEEDENRELCRVIQRSFADLGGTNSALNSSIY